MRANKRRLTQLEGIGIAIRPVDAGQGQPRTLLGRRRPSLFRRGLAVVAPEVQAEGHFLFIPRPVRRSGSWTSSTPRTLADLQRRRLVGGDLEMGRSSRCYSPRTPIWRRCRPCAPSSIPGSLASRRNGELAPGGLRANCPFSPKATNCECFPAPAPSPVRRSQPPQLTNAPSRAISIRKNAPSTSNSLPR